MEQTLFMKLGYVNINLGPENESNLEEFYHFGFQLVFLFTILFVGKSAHLQLFVGPVEK